MRTSDARPPLHSPRSAHPGGRTECSDLRALMDLMGQHGQEWDGVPWLCDILSARKEAEPR